jgi:hypothetical protein
VDDAERFLEACTVAECLPESQSPTGEVATLQKIDDQTYIVEDVECNAYCIEWAHILLDLGHGAEPWRLRKVLEAFKLKVHISYSIYYNLMKHIAMLSEFLGSVAWHAVSLCLEEMACICGDHM